MGEMKNNFIDVDNKKNKSDFVVPKQILGASFYWYERDPELFHDEVKAMNHYFPKYKLTKMRDGRIAWHGKIKPENIRKNSVWEIMVVYDNNHPHNNSWGGSLRVYSVVPDLNAYARKKNLNIPHTLRDSFGNLYICTAHPGDFDVGDVITSASSAVGWAATWISKFELWDAGIISIEDFKSERPPRRRY